MTKSSIILAVIAVVSYIEAVPLPQSDSRFAELAKDPLYASELKKFIIDWLHNTTGDVIPENIFKQLENDRLVVKEFNKFFANLLNSQIPVGTGSSFYQNQVAGSGGNPGSYQSVGWTSISRAGEGTKIDVFSDKNGAVLHKQFYQ